MEVLELHADNLGLHLHNIEIEPTLQIVALLLVAPLLILIQVISIEKLSLTLLYEWVQLLMVDNVADEFEHLADHVAVQSNIRVDLIQIVHVIIRDVLDAHPLLLRRLILGVVATLKTAEHFHSEILDLLPDLLLHNLELSLL